MLSINIQKWWGWGWKGEWVSALKGLMERHFKLVVCKTYFTLLFSVAFFLPFFLHVCVHVHNRVNGHVCICNTQVHSLHCVLYHVSLIKCREKECQETIGSRTRTTNDPFFSYQDIVNHFSAKANSFWFPLK